MIISQTWTPVAMRYSHNPLPTARYVMFSRKKLYLFSSKIQKSFLASHDKQFSREWLEVFDWWSTLQPNSYQENRQNVEDSSPDTSKS